jgi:type II secretory pathway pseudopilin PulG
MIELLVVMAILGVVISGITAAFVSGSKSEVDLNRRFVGQQNSRLALSQLRKDIHTACDATVPSAGKLYLTPPVGIGHDSAGQPYELCGSTPTVVWCTGTSAFNAVRRDVPRDAGGSGCQVLG